MNRRRCLLALTLGLSLLALLLGAPAAAQSNDDNDGSGAEVVLTIFHGDGCPHCADALVFLDELQQRWPDLTVAEFEVWNDADNRMLFREMAAEYGFEARGVPTIFLGDRYWVGYARTIDPEIEAAVEALLQAHDTPAAEPEAPEGDQSSNVDVPLFGSVEVGGKSMVAATLLIGFADGLNPCSLWALSILLALVLHSGSRRRVLVVGSTFLLVTSALYGVYMAGAYSALDYASEMSWIRAAVACVAGLFGLVHMKSWFTGGSSALSIPDDRKPSMFRRMRALADPDRSLPAVLGGTIVLATGVSLLETPCTAGLPLLWTDMLAERNISTGGVVLLFAVYLGVFLLDELILFGLAVTTLRATKLQEHHGRALHLVSGTLMVVLALTMLFSPERLESVTGTVLVVGLAAALAGVLHIGSRILVPSMNR